ncbi:FkbM family methyltransferase [Peribacillus frigoritolerans]|uniref:FkbM family methyltransferase n=1 Tax=Peribacillus frigoritolerans TaxID=450367 RepID=UPI002B24111B|nr:FkbM family methyltransferase [Peribacillus frigoritolerans]
MYYSQIGQDKYVNERIFQGKENGFFVDIGAHDGIGINNTYFFEKHKNWNGICVEPLPEVYELLNKNRKCICIEGAIHTQHGYQEFFRLNGQYAMLSGLINEYDARHLERIKGEIENNQQNIVIKVRTIPLQSILDEHNVNHIDFLSIDTEGSELTVLQSINFNQVKIDCITVENNFQERSVQDFLMTKGYRLAEKLAYDDIYIRNDSSLSVS